MRIDSVWCKWVVGAWAGLVCQLALPADTDGFAMARCLNMGNALETPNGYDWGGRYYAQADYARIAEAGFDTVRIPVRWSDYTGPAPAYRIHPDFAALVDDNIGWALDSGLNVILNVHHFEKLMAWPASQTDRFRAIWQQLSVRYADLPASVWFELLNEPHDQLAGDAMRQVQVVGLQAIRQHNPHRTVILGGEAWSGVWSLDSNLSTDDANVVYTFHYYQPFDFTHQAATWLGDKMPEGRRGWGSDQDRADLADDVATVTRFRERVGRPVFLGEFGVNSPVEPRDRVTWVGAVTAAMEAAGVPWCLWAYANTFALYRDDSGWDTEMLQVLTDD